MEFLERLQNIEKKINENKITKAKFEQKVEQLKEEYNNFLTELSVIGIKEEDLGQTLTNLNVTIDETLSNHEESLK